MKFFVLHDLPLSRQRLIAHLSRYPGIEVVGETGDPLAAICLIREQRPDVVILDMRVSKRFGIDVLRNIKKVSPAPAVVMFTSGLCSPRRGRYSGDEADACFHKFAELDEVIGTFMGSSRKESGHAHTEAAAPVLGRTH